MKPIPIIDDRGLGEAAEAMLKNALQDPVTVMLFDRLLTDPEVDRQTLFATAFNFGASYALSEMMKGNITKLNLG